MASTAKDALPETTAAGLAQGSEPPSNAVGAEVPVTIHASRYSAASKAAAKLAPIHEETRTVIIFPQGAVVRLSATVTLGELVVLTNKRTGADVICRVTSVKTQPGIQNYVHLEFTQRALDFWEEARATGGSALTGKGPAVTAPPAVSPASTPMAPSNRPPSLAVQDVQPVAKAVPAVEFKPAFLATPKVTPLADLPAAKPEKAPEAPAAIPQASEIAASPTLAQKRPHFMPSRTPRLQPFEPLIGQKRSSSKTIVLFAIAAVALLAIGAAGASLLLRHDRGLSVAQQVLANPPVATTPTTLPAASELQRPSVNSSGAATSLEPLANAPAKSSAFEAPTQPVLAPAVVEPPKKKELQPEPPPQRVTRPSINVGKIAAPKLKTATQLNSSEPPPVLPASANALPGAIGENIISTTARDNLPRPTEPASPTPVQGGRLQQPKLLSSVAATYPPLAHAQHLQGDVIIDALIDKTGQVAATTVISGNPLLQNAAVDSLRHWKYDPARLNGEPIPIHIKVTITFHLN